MVSNHAFFFIFTKNFIMASVIVLGCGMVGRAMVLDLAKKHRVAVVDRSEHALETVQLNGVEKHCTDLSDSTVVAQLIAPFDLVVSAVPGFLGFQTLKTVIEAGKNFVDISFLPEDILQLDELAKARGVTGIADMGVAPGMPNLIAGYHYHRMKVNEFSYMVGGLPLVRSFPFEYKAPFSPIDVVEEYTRPARLKENGVLVTRPAMSDPELIHFDHIGTLEAFNTDGLRSLLFTLPGIPSMKEKTLRYPGHIRLIQALMSSGFFSHEPVAVGGSNVVPFDFTTSLLFKSWKLGSEEREFTVMRVSLSGESEGKYASVQYDLFDEYDPLEKVSSMARTTGYTGTAGAGLILDGVFSKHGVYPPELVGEDERCFQYVMNHLSERGVVYRVS